MRTSVCWICQINEANSAEHKIKGSILKRYFGKKYKNGEMLYGQGDEMSEIESFKDKQVKFPKVICIECNERNTRNHDIAFDQFTEYIENNYNEIFSMGSLDFNEVFGEKWKTKKRDLYKYFAKHAGCKIISGDKYFDLTEFSKFIIQDENATNFKIHFQLKEGIKFLHDYYRKAPNLFNGPTIYFGKNESTEFNLGGWISHLWISIYWVASKEIRNNSDFSNQIEVVEIKEIPEVNKLQQCDSVRKMMDVVEYDGLETLENQNEFYLNLLNK